MKDASVIIVTYGQWSYTERCLQSLELALGPKLGAGWEIIVVDNDSPDETPQRLPGWSDRVRVELLAENRDFAGGSNRGAELAESEVLIFLNNDTEVPPGALERLAEQVREPDVAVAGCRLLFPSGAVQHAGVAFWRDERFGGLPMPLHVFFGEDQDLSATYAVYEADTVTGACMAVRRDAFMAVGGFDEAFHNGYEDTDLCFRLRAAGHKVVLRGDVTITHHEGASRDSERRPIGPGEPVRVMATAHDLNADNTNLFLSRWGTQLEQDDALVLAVWDGSLRKHAPPRTHGRIADVLLIGQPSGIGPGAEESRALIAALAGSEVGVAAVDIHPNVVARVSGEQLAALETALRAVPRPEAVNLYVASGRGFEYHDPSHQVAPTPGSLLRLAAADHVLELSDVARILVPTAAIASRLQADGVTEGKITIIPSPVEQRALGTGGNGILLLLPTQNPQLSKTILRELPRPSPSLTIRVLPTVFHRDLVKDLASCLPGAELLAPCSDEERFAHLASTADVVLALDPSDHFERRALVAASVGARPLTFRANGPAAEVLGDDVVTTPGGLRSAVLEATAGAAPRARWQQAVRAQCDPALVRPAILAPPVRT